jgi:hypothetical protein
VDGFRLKSRRSLQLSLDRFDSPRRESKDVSFSARALYSRTKLVSQILQMENLTAVPHDMLSIRS